MKGWAAILGGLLLACGAQAATYVAVPAGRYASVLPQGALPTATTDVDVPAFRMRATPVTVAEFAQFVRAHPQWQRGRAPSVFTDKRYLVTWAGPTEPGPQLRADAPVVDVSWFAAKAFCEAEGARLPTWSEWEYTAAADATVRDARKNPEWQRRVLAWYERPASEALPAVGGPPNAYGISDLHGVIWEWVDDFNALFIAGDSRTQGDPDLLKFCGAGAINIVDREGFAVVMRIALLSSLDAQSGTGTLGFRCAQSL